MRPTTFLVVMIIACLSAGDAMAQVARRGTIGSKPELEFNTSDGQKFGMKDLQGKIVLVYFWSLGTAYDDEAAQLVKMNEQLGPKGLELIGLVIGVSGPVRKDDPAEKFTWPHVKVAQPMGGGFGFITPDMQFSEAAARQERPWAAIVAPDGSLVWNGKFADVDKAVAAAFKQFPPKLLDKDILEKAHSALKSAEVSLKIGKTLDAVHAIASVPDEARGEYRIRIAAKRLEREVDKAATTLMRDIDLQIAGKEYGAAWGQLMAILKAVPGSELGGQAKTRLDTLLKRADAKAAIEKEKRNITAAAELDAAQRLQSDRKDRAAYAKFKFVAKSYADTPSAAAAAEAVAVYDRDPDFAKGPATAPAASADSKARGMLSMAASYAQSGRVDQAKKKYQEVVDQFPGTTFADTAKAELGKLK